LRHSPGRPPLWLRGLCRGGRWCVAALAGALLSAAVSVSQGVDEYIIKAQALVELSPYFKWPEPKDPSHTFLIAVVGKSPFGTKLDTYARSRTIQGRRLEIRYVARVWDVPTCDLAFICRSERRYAGEILDWVRGKGILTVSDDEALLKKGVMVDLLIESGLLKLYLNAQAVAAEKLSVSSQLLRLTKTPESR